MITTRCEGCRRILIINDPEMEAKLIKGYYVANCTCGQKTHLSIVKKLEPGS